MLIRPVKYSRLWSDWGELTQHLRSSDKEGQEWGGYQGWEQPWLCCCPVFTP